MTTMTDLYNELTEMRAVCDSAFDDIAQLREAARAYRQVLYGAEMNGQLSADFIDELERAEERYAALIDTDLDDEEEDD